MTNSSKFLLLGEELYGRGGREAKHHGEFNLSLLPHIVVISRKCPRNQVEINALMHKNLPGIIDPDCKTIYNFLRPSVESAVQPILA